MHKNCTEKQELTPALVLRIMAMLQERSRRRRASLPSVSRAKTRQGGL